MGAFTAGCGVLTAPGGGNRPVLELLPASIGSGDYTACGRAFQAFTSKLNRIIMYS
jgi:hypothetical protein